MSDLLAEDVETRAMLMFYEHTTQHVPPEHQTKWEQLSDSTRERWLKRARKRAASRPEPQS